MIKIDGKKLTPNQFAKIVIVLPINCSILSSSLKTGITIETSGVKILLLRVKVSVDNEDFIYDYMEKKLI